MSATKTKMSITISNDLAHLIETSAKAYDVPKSALIEKAIEIWRVHQVEEEAKKMAAIEIDDLPTEEEWAQIQAPIKWKWEE